MNIELLQRISFNLLFILLILLALANAISEGHSNFFRKLKCSRIGQKVIVLRNWFMLYGEEIIFFILIGTFIILILGTIF